METAGLWEGEAMSETFIAIGTMLLVVVTGALAVATFRLVRQTGKLAEVTREEMAKQARLTKASSDALIEANLKTSALMKSISEGDLAQRRQQATYEAWRQLRQRIGFKPVPKDARRADLPEDHRHSVAGGLRELEYFASGAKRGLFETDMIAEMSGSWILERISWAQPYIDDVRKIRSDKPDLYSQTIWLRTQIENYQKVHPSTTFDEENES
jgi:hypothetical protein